MIHSDCGHTDQIKTSDTGYDPAAETSVITSLTCYMCHSQEGEVTMERYSLLDIFKYINFEYVCFIIMHYLKLGWVMGSN